MADRGTRQKARTLARQLFRLLPRYGGRELDTTQPEIARFKMLVDEAKQLPADNGLRRAVERWEQERGVTFSDRKHSQMSID